MKNKFENEIPQNPQRLSFEDDEGWYEDESIPYDIYYQFDCPSTHLVDDKHPGKHMITPDSGGGESLSIFVHESVPVKFKDIVVFHELREAEARYSKGLSLDDAHKVAAKEESQYARTHLSQEDFEEFLKWQETLDNEKI